MPDPAANHQADRQLPVGNEIFLDHVAHFVRDAKAASEALARCGFAPTPVSIQIAPDASGAGKPTGTGNITVMFERGYAEILFKTSDTPLSEELDTAIARYAGIHLAAFAVADAGTSRERLAAEGFRVRDLVNMSRPVDTEAGPDRAAFSVARVEPGVMPEGRIQTLTHHTEHTVWQKRWLTHPNSTVGLIDVVIAVADVAEAAKRFSRFTGRAATRTPSGAGALIRLDRGGINLVSHELAAERLPELAFPTLPFMIGYALRVKSLATAEMTVEAAGLAWHSLDGGIAASFPIELGEGAWFFVEDPSGLPWRR